MTTSYDSKAIRHLTSVEAVRLKPSMYGGELGPAMVFQALRELTDNFVDEALQGKCTEGSVFLDDDHSYWVLDNGRGMPVGPTVVTDSVSGKPYNVSSLYAITGLLHAGGKLSESADSAYLTSRGTHGIGQKFTNFVSKYFEVWTCHQGSWFNIRYENGLVTSNVAKTKAPAHPYKKGFLKSGTLIHFLPDPKVVQASSFTLRLFGDWARIAAYFTPGLTVTLCDHKGRERSWSAPEGPKQYVVDRLVENKCAPITADSPPFMHCTKLADVVLQWTDFDACDLAAFTNGLSNPDKGLHWQSVINAMDKVIRTHAKPKQNFSVADLREGLVGLVNAKLSSPKFSSQTKDKLVDDRAGKPLQDELTTAFEVFFRKHKALAARIIERCCALAKLKTQFLASKTVLKDLAAIKKKGLPAKAAIAPNCKPEERETYILEGDSAAGLARQARNPHYQEILPLKGKIMNALRNKESQVLASEEVLQILTLIGFDPKAEDPLSKLRVGKIIQLADPDPDGPLVGDTLVSVVMDNCEWRDVPIATLCESEDPDYTLFRYRVVTYSHALKGFKLVRPTAAHTFQHKDKDDLIYITWSDGSKNICTPRHKWLVARRELEGVDMRRLNAFNARAAEHQEHFLPSSVLKTGDVIVKHLSDPRSNVSSKAAHVSVAKIKAKSSVARNVYCLTVPDTHNFRLSSGVMSGNCHINTLLLSLFYKFMPGLFDRGMIYVAEPCEFYAELKSGKALFGKSVNALREQLKQAGEPNRQINHVKGWGEFEPHLLRETAFDPATRTLSQIIMLDSEDGPEFVKVMSDDVATRKQLLGV